VTRSLRSDEDHVDTLRSVDVSEANVESVCEGEGLARGQVRRDGLAVDGALVLVRRKDHDQVCPLRRLGDGLDCEASLFSLRGRLRALLEGNGDLDAGVAKVLRVRMALRTVTDDRDLLALDQGQVCVGVVEDLGAHLYFSLIVVCVSL
jgi:hypothetical protein